MRLPWLADEVAADYGAADALVNSAGIMQNNIGVDEMNLDEHDLIWDVNYRGTFLASRAFARAMRARGKGAIVNIASITALRPLPLFAYGPGKAAIVSLTATLAGHWGPHGVRVNAVAPGYVATEQLMGRVDAGHRRLEDLTHPSALGRMVRPDEIAAAIAFLVDDAASAITGITLPVDAGWLAGSAWATYGGIAHGK
ncbi:SDR family NAD(P)-dependent oxidoreductase [Pararhodobacter sp.]|uniref:SDR family NAD(P)-dependent oxidoreductase n=1 Tax=Pararhodobacter sp. TaxID=2127056 RepID=UPI002FDEA3BD